MKKSFLSRGLLVLILSLIFSLSVFAKDTPHLFLNGQLKDVEIVLKNSNTLVPLRFCSEELQATVGWDKSIQEITITKGDDKILFKIGSLDYFHNSKAQKLLATPELMDGVTYVPFRPLIEALDGIVLYNNEHKFINIYDAKSEAYKVYKSLNSKSVTEKRFAMLESPRVSHISDIDATMHEYIFPLETTGANYFLEYQASWADDPNISLKYYSIVDGVAVNIWGRQLNNYANLQQLDSHPLLTLIDDAESKNKIEFGRWPNPSDLNYLMFLQDKSNPVVYYLNDVWTDSFALDPIEIGKKAINPFSNKDILLFDVDNEYLLSKYKN